MYVQRFDTVIVINESIQMFFEDEFKLAVCYELCRISQFALEELTILSFPCLLYGLMNLNGSNSK